MKEGKNADETKNSYDEGALPPSLSSAILDSSLISATKSKILKKIELKNIIHNKLKISTTKTTKNENLYNVKVVRLGNHIQVYEFENKKRKPKTDDEKELLLKKINLTKDKNNEKKIELKNIMRSKLKCQRLAKCNSDKCKTFITLTFNSNIFDIKIANKQYKYFQDKVRRIFPNFMCIGIPEFMKNGRVHYHLLTNIPAGSDIIPKRKPLKLWNKETKSYKVLDYYDIKFWNNGFSSAEIIEGDIKKIIGYISKYMTKDIDDRLFGHHRYFYTHNLNTPIFDYLNLDNTKHRKFLENLLENKSLIYSNNYTNSYNNEKIAFKEFLTTS